MQTNWWRLAVCILCKGREGILIMARIFLIREVFTFLENRDIFYKNFISGLGVGR